MAITHEIIESYENYGRCVKISNRIIEAYVTIDVGPRIIRFAHCNGDNIFYNDIERKSNRSGEKYDEYYYESATWYIYGGHRLWLRYTWFCDPADHYQHGFLPGGLAL